jgi:putative tricarboxylic transport membrane protein
MPNLPTMKEQGIDVVPFQMWRGVAMPKNVPPDAVAYWQGVMQKVAASKAYNDYIKQNVATAQVMSGPEYVKFLEAQEALYRDMLKRLGVI